jgi:hypothetical protein
MSAAPAQPCPAPPPPSDSFVWSLVTDVSAVLLPAYVLSFTPRQVLTLNTLTSTLQAPTVAAATRTVTSLQDTIYAQVPEKQAAIAALKRDHGSHV